MCKTTKKTIKKNKTKINANNLILCIFVVELYSINFVVFASGCIGDDGKCYDIGDELIEDCSKFTCTTGGVMQESEFGKDTK